MKCQILFSVKSSKNNINLWSAELAHKVVKINGIFTHSLLVDTITGKLSTLSFIQCLFYGKPFNYIFYKSNI